MLKCSEGSGVTITTQAGVDYVHLTEADFSETGSSGFDLTVGSQDTSSLRPFVGVSIDKSFTTDSGLVLIPKANLAFSRKVLDDARQSVVEVGGGSFIVDGVTPSRDELTLGGSLAAQLTNRLAFYADYHAILPTGNLVSQTVSLSLRYRF